MRERLQFGKIFILGTGFMVISMIWAAYNSYMPIFLGRYTDSNTFIGFVMVWDNVANLILLPIIGALSDRTYTRLGRRMPYIVIGMPLAGLLYILLPHMATLPTIFGLLAMDLVFTIIVALYRSPVVALMPDIVPEARRSEANGIINLMGGLGALIMFFLGSQLYNMDPSYPFLFVGILSLLIPFLLFLTIREPAAAYRKEREIRRGEPLFRSLGRLVSAKEKGPLFTLLAIFFMTAGFGAVETFFTRYTKLVLGIPEGTSSFTLGFYALSFLIFSLPAGWIGARIGKRKMMITGALLLGLLILLFSSVHNFTLIQILLPVAGILNALFSINSYPMVVSFTNERQVGTYTGFYYFFSSLAAILSPPLFGWVVDRTGFTSLFIVSGISILWAGLIMMRVPERKNASVEPSTSI
ncbi:MAG: MFS transporter [Thermicanus sp.]|nr:MFS transporter [Thermicanus sp.]